MKILFLDIDGVLNSNNYAVRYHQEHLQEKGQHIFVDPAAVELVRDLCEKEQVKIVLSSSWRSYNLVHTIEELNRYRDLRPLLQFIIGITVGMMSRHRGEEIRRTLEEWRQLSDRGLIDSRYRDVEVEKYVIVDDDLDFLPEQKTRLIHTNWVTGITKENVEQIKEVLK